MLGRKSQNTRPNIHPQYILWASPHVCLKLFLDDLPYLSRLYPSRYSSDCTISVDFSYQPDFYSPPCPILSLWHSPVLLVWLFLSANVSYCCHYCYCQYYYSLLTFLRTFPFVEYLNVALFFVWDLTEFGMSICSSVGSPDS